MKPSGVARDDSKSAIRHSERFFQADRCGAKTPHLDRDAAEPVRKRRKQKKENNKKSL